MDYIIAIDGPSGVGKSTIAKKLSKILKINYIDTGAMYRAIAFKLISNNIPLDNHEKIKEILENTDFTYKANCLYMDGVKLGKEIRTDEISKGASLGPNVAFITNVGTSHIGMLGSRENIARAKAEILVGMRPTSEDQEGVIEIGRASCRERV